MEQLFKELARFGWSLSTLKIWDLSDFKCVYCPNERNMLESIDINYLGVLDHLLPQSKYPLLASCPTNLVLSCWVCNRIKRHWDPNTRVADPIYLEGPLSDGQRSELIQRAKRYVTEKRAEKTESLQKQIQAIEAYRLRRDSGAG